MRYLLLQILALFSGFVCTISLSAQTNQFLTRADSDPAALTLLAKMDSQLKNERLSVEFEVSISHPAEKPITYQGRLIQQGEMYRINAEDIEIWCNGNLRWVYTKDANEVNLYTVDADETPGPLGLITAYTGDQYIAVVHGTEQIRSLSTQVIELKPVDRDSEIAKVKLYVQHDGKPVRMEVIEKGAIRTISDILKITVPEPQPVTYFIFNKADFPGVHLEDLRID